MQCFIVHKPNRTRMDKARIQTNASSIWEYESCGQLCIGWSIIATGFACFNIVWKFENKIIDLPKHFSFLFFSSQRISESGKWMPNNDESEWRQLFFHSLSFSLFSFRFVRLCGVWKLTEQASTSFFPFNHSFTSALSIIYTKHVSLPYVDTPQVILYTSSTINFCFQRAMRAAATTERN